LRCPDCRAKLRLAEAPEPGTEIECPECKAIFQAPDPETGEVPDERGAKKSKKKDDKAKASDKPRDKGVPRKRKAKKKETNKGALIAVIIGGILFASFAIGTLIWFFTKKPVAYEMMKYLPEDSTEAVGVNLGHMYKYSEFIKVVEPTYTGLGFWKAIDATAKVFGIEPRDLPDYMVQGWGKNGGALVIRTKKEFDPADLKKLPGAQEGKADGVTYYSISPFPKLFGGAPLKVFAPTNRLIVFCEYNLPSPTFSKMLTGNTDGEIITKRLGQLGSRVVKGTFWSIAVLDSGNRAQEPKESKDSDGGHFQRAAASFEAKAKGRGFKASLGSRAVRFELVAWFENSDVTSELYKTWKQSDIIKAQDDSSLDPPKMWKDFAEKVLGSKKVANELFTNLGFKSSGELFIFYSECETKILMEIVAGLVNKITGQNQGGMVMPGVGGSGPPGGGGPPAPGGGGPPAPGGGGPPAPGGGPPRP
jgi:hypothetical protein